MSISAPVVADPFVDPEQRPQRVDLHHRHTASVQGSAAPEVGCGTRGGVGAWQAASNNATIASECSRRDMPPR